MCIIDVCDCLNIAAVLGRGDAGHRGGLNCYAVMKTLAHKAVVRFMPIAQDAGCSIALCFASVTV